MIGYGFVMALGAFVLTWLEYQHAVRLFSTEAYILVLAVLFTAMGIWVGHRLTGARGKEAFEKNTRALQSLGISEREYQVLELLAEGCTNREIGNRLFISANTVKTHLARLYEKLEVSRRTQAIHRAKALRLIP